ncbi:hypothetical protein DSO57_1035018 [Entomophthora muscae]|uniref:Uncharacterized protein n=1 Tax=Entomophthora muscae TaxID=34485 RepID=A0ACC2U8N9_9FUNG|nr:hypothetical protein DSO57_1035018 [Entomophthora muscae]
MAHQRQNQNMVNAVIHNTDFYFDEDVLAFLDKVKTFTVDYTEEQKIKYLLGSLCQNSFDTIFPYLGFSYSYQYLQKVIKQRLHYPQGCTKASPINGFRITSTPQDFRLDASEEESKNLKQTDVALNENDIETLSTFNLPSNATSIIPEVNVPNLPSGVMTNTAGSLADVTAGLGKHTSNNATNLLEEDMNGTIETPQPKFPATDLPPVNETATERLQVAPNAIASNCLAKKPCKGWLGLQAIEDNNLCHSRLLKCRTEVNSR